MNEMNARQLARELDRIAEAAEDSVTDDMVSRLSATAAETIDLLDRINRSGLDRAIPTLAEMANNGDLERLAGLARVLSTAEDAVTDDMVGRLADTAGSGMALLDRINRSGLDKAIPVLSRMAENGDLERVAQLARLLGAAEDAVTDDMVGRLGETIGGAMTLADKAGRSRIAEALPIIDDMVASGDLKRLADMARLVGAAEDAVNDDMVARLAEMAGEAISVVDRLNRSGLGRLVEVVERLDASGELDAIAETLPKASRQLSLFGEMAECLDRASEEVKSTPPATGGIGGLFRLMRDRENQEFMRFAMVVGRQLKERCLKRV